MLENNGKFQLMTDKLEAELIKCHIFCFMCSVKKRKIMQQILFSIVSPNIQHKKSLQRIESALIKASLYQKKTENILLIQNILHLNDKLQ